MILSGFAIFAVVVVVLAIVLIFAGVKVVPQSEEWTIERFGRYTRTLSPGLNLVVPLVDRVGAKLSLRETVFDVEEQEVITKDNAMVKVDGVVFYQVVNSSKAAYEVNNLQYAILNLTMTNIRTVLGSMDLDHMLSQRDDINERLLGVVDSAASPWGVKITRIEIKDISPPRDLVDSMARQMKAERDKRATILDAEGERSAEILKAEGAKQGAILEAEGRKEAAFRDAEAREREAQAEASATESVSTAIANGNVAAINYFVAQRYVEALEKLASAPNQRVILMPLEAANVIGALGGIAELAKETFGKDSGGGAPPPRRPSAPPAPKEKPWNREE